jgi:iron complex transport system substrate-binding protein
MFLARQEDHMHIRTRLVATLLALVAVLAACGGDDDDAASSTTEPSATSAPEAPPFPVTVTGANGEVTINDAPQRIVSLSATSTEDLFAIGAGDQVEAVDDQSNFPADAPKTELSGYPPNVEAIGGYDPDLVVMSDASVVGELEAIDVPVLVLEAATTIDEAYDQIATLGKATGHVDEANQLVDEMKNDIDEIVASVDKSNPPLTYYHELDQTLYTATSRSFMGQIYALLGLENVSDDADDGSGYPQVSAEHIVSANPDLIFLADTKCCGQSATTVAARDGWSGIAAVQNGNVVELDDDIASRWGPRIVDLLRTIAKEVQQVNDDA